jgi:hypothetical protein
MIILGLVIFLSFFVAYRGFDVVLCALLKEGGSLAPYLAQTSSLTNSRNLFSSLSSVVLVQDTSFLSFNSLELLVLWIIVAGIYQTKIENRKFSLLATYATSIGLFFGLNGLTFFQNSSLIKECFLFSAQFLITAVAYFFSFLALSRVTSDSRTKYLLLLSLAPFVIVIATIVNTLPPVAILYVIWFCVLSVPVGVLSWLLLTTKIHVYDVGVGCQLFLSLVFGIVIQGILAWILLAIDRLSALSIALVEVMLVSIIVYLTKTVVLTKIRCMQKIKIARSFAIALLTAFVVLFLMLQGGWFTTNIQEIPWSDTWVWWGRGLSVAYVGKFWDAGYLSLGNSPFVSALFASIFSIWPEKVGSLFFMKVFSLFLDFLMVTGLFILVNRLLERLQNLEETTRLLISSFSALVFASNSWVLYYTYYFVRELLGIPLFLVALIVITLYMKNKQIQLLLAGGCCVLMFLISPFTAFYSSFLLLFIVLFFILEAVHARSMVFKIGVVLFSSLVLILILVISTFSLSPNSLPLVANVHPQVISQFLIVYDVISSGGLVAWVLSIVGFIVFILISLRIKRTRYLLLPLLLLAAVFLVTLFFPLGDYVYRNALYLGIGSSVFSALGVSYLLFSRKDSSHLNKKNVAIVLVLILILSQILYPMYHVSNLDHSNENEVVTLLLNLDQKLPQDCLVIPDGPLVDKALGLLAPRPIHTWSFLSDFQNPGNNLTTLMRLIDFAVKNNVYFVALSGGNYFVDNVLLSALANIDTISNTYNMSVYYLGTPLMLTYGYRDIYLFNFSSVSTSTNTPIRVPLQEFKEDLSFNVKNIGILSTGSSLRITLEPYNNSSSYIWLRAELGSSVTLADHESLIMNVNGSENSFINFGIGNSENTFQACTGNYAATVSYFLDLSKELEANPENGTIPSNFSYVWIALAGSGQSVYSFNISSIFLSHNIIKTLN